MADLPGFFFNVQKYRGSRSVHRMSFSERGVYVEMLLEEWEKGRLPDDPQAVASAIASTSAQVTEILAAWPIVRPKFVTDRRHPGRMYNIALEQTRRAQRIYREKRRDAGRRGGKAKASNYREGRHLSSSNATAPLQPGHSETYRLDQIRLDQRSVLRTDLLRTSFDCFWDLYPRKISKDAAWRSWQKLKPDESLLSLIATALAQQAKSSQWTRDNGQYIPYASTWLNQKRWQDEAPKASSFERPPWECPHTPKCLHPTPCGIKQQIEEARAARAGKP